MAEGYWVRVAGRLRRVVDARVGRFAGVLRRFFAGQADRATDRLFAFPVVAAVGAVVLVPDGEVRLLDRAVRPWREGAFRDAAGLASAVAGGPALADDDPRMLAMLAQGATRVRAITERTRAEVRRTLVEGARRAYSAEQIAYGVEADGFRGLRAAVAEAYRGRALTIARTELALAAQAAALASYGDAGVGTVRVFDGAGCGWRFHDDPDKANGTTRTVGDAAAHPLAHPNCRRVFLP